MKSGFGQVYRVKSVKGLTFKEELVWGLHDPSNYIIFIEKDIPLKDQFLTLFHECGHALFEQTGLNQSIEFKLEHIAVENYAKFISKIVFGS